MKDDEYDFLGTHDWEGSNFGVSMSDGFVVARATLVVRFHILTLL